MTASEADMWIAQMINSHNASNIGYLIARYGHIVAAMLLIGGVLFHEMVVPLALSDEKEESRLALFARTRWSFRRIVWGCMALIIFSGAVMSYHRVPIYLEQEYSVGNLQSGVPHALPIGLRTGWWWVAHVSTGVMAMIIALYVIAGDRPVANPISWLRLDLVMLLVVVFLGSVTHYVYMVHLERAFNAGAAPARVYYVVPRDVEPSPTTAPTSNGAPAVFP
jgi:hypothetical protein